mgnify:FL=1
MVREPEAGERRAGGAEEGAHCPQAGRAGLVMRELTFRTAFASFCDADSSQRWSRSTSPRTLDQAVPLLHKDRCVRPSSPPARLSRYHTFSRSMHQGTDLPLHARLDARRHLPALAPRPVPALINDLPALAHAQREPLAALHALPLM